MRDVFSIDPPYIKLRLMQIVVYIDEQDR
jgi:hypothetical protein